MVNELVFSPLGMIVVAIIAILFYRKRSRAAYMFFAFGGAVWAAAIGLKVVLDLTVTPAISNSLYTSFDPGGYLVAIGLYVGLRTGFFECGFTYIALRGRWLEGITLRDAMAFGVGFGATEALFLGILTLAGMLITEPEASVLLVPAAIIERVFVIFVHVFTTMLVFLSIREGRIILLVMAILFKTLLDGAIPFLQDAFGSSVGGVYLIEIFVVVMGLISLMGIIRITEKYKETQYITGSGKSARGM